MKVLGIDPGTHRVGWGVIEKTGSKCGAVAHGCLEFPPHTASTTYLPLLQERIIKLLHDHNPDRLGIETLLFQKNVKTAISVAEARGVILLAAAESSIPVVERAPNRVKLATTGHGDSNKRAVARMVGLLLGVNTKGLLDDEVDALAIAYASLS